MKAGIDHRLNWHIVRTRPQGEWKVATKLEELGYAVYLPTMRVEVKNKRTHTYSTKERVLMAGYLFLGATRPLYWAANCDGVIGILSNSGYEGEPARVPSTAVEAIYLAEIDLAFDDTRAARIHRKEEARTRKLTLELTFLKGDIWTVSSGPFATMQGEVGGVTPQGQVELLMDLFGRATVAKFDASQLSIGEKFLKAG